MTGRHYFDLADAKENTGKASIFLRTCNELPRWGKAVEYAFDG
jgi:hypothetical protein